MLAGGKEVKHFIIDGETFSKSNYGKKVKILKDFVAGRGYTNIDGKYRVDDGISGVNVIPAGTLGYVIVGTFGECYYICHSTDIYKRGAWVSKDMVEILENGGVNSPSYLPFIYDIWEVAPYVC